MSITTDKIPEYGIASRIEKGAFPDQSQIAFLVIEIEGFLDGFVEDNLNTFLSKRNEDKMMYKDTSDFFRKRERYNQSKFLLQYLVHFLKSLPMEDRISKMPVDPFGQLKEFVSFHVELLKEDDVVEAVLREYKMLQLLSDKNIWYYKGKMKSTYSSIRELVNSAQHAEVEDYLKLFKALKKLCIYWFSIRREDESRVRKSDLYVYSVVRVLIHKLQT
ncbi:MAG: hypothetical protein ABFR75_02995 [Acidobacteriota bacterium]